jgi:hypothetical protein
MKSAVPPPNRKLNPGQATIVRIIWAIAGIVLLLNLYVSRFAITRRDHMRIENQSAIKQLGRGLLMYAQDHDDHLPGADNWRTAALYYIDGHLSVTPEGKDFANTSFALNGHLAGIARSRIPGQDKTVLLFLSDLKDAEPVGARRDLAFTSSGDTILCMADGSARIASDNRMELFGWYPVLGPEPVLTADEDGEGIP